MTCPPGKYPSPTRVRDRILGLVDDAHSAGSNFGYDLVIRNPLSNHCPLGAHTALHNESVTNDNCEEP